jgi:catechol 2,3-dioxygenase-like lactoylglutathione lyase family enzyme
MTPMHIEHVALQVSDPAAMAQWYVDHLGCSIARSGGAPGFIHFLKDATGHSMLEIYTNPRCTVPDYASMDVMLVHVAFYSDDPRADRDRLVKAGATIAEDHIVTPAGDEMLILRDPWGLALQLVKRAQPMLVR